jgi:hypothetical protein
VPLVCATNVAQAYYFAALNRPGLSAEPAARRAPPTGQPPVTVQANVNEFDPLQGGYARIDRRPRAVNGFIADAPSVVGVLTEVLIARSP